MKLRKLLIALLAAALLCTAVGAAGYSDLPDTHWANKQVAYLQGEIKGYPDGTFRPNNTVTRAEFLTMFARVAYPEEYQAQEASAWWQPAYAVCTAHELLADITGERAEPMPRHEIASLLGRFCSGWGGMNESTSAAMPLNINWKEQRLESPERQPIFSDTAKYERSSDNIRFCANQGLLLTLCYLAARVILRSFRWIFLFGFLYDFAVTLVGLAALALGIYMAVQLRKYGRVTQLPYVGKYTLIR